MLNRMCSHYTLQIFPFQRDRSLILPPSAYSLPRRESKLLRVQSGSSAFSRKHGDRTASKSTKGMKLEIFSHFSAGKVGGLDNSYLENLLSLVKKMRSSSSGVTGQKESAQRISCAP